MLALQLREVVQNSKLELKNINKEVTRNIRAAYQDEVLRCMKGF